ncbi:NAD-dependent protein deacetylase sirtuin-2-like [Amphiura filiformis]|uniref:NAD-dependent protein deacetylase sirtuin-2-like n=1 Tax=Amphiura filiformis TaxID=82378 RepID=UPI003B21CA6E
MSKEDHAGHANDSPESSNGGAAGGGEEGPDVGFLQNLLSRFHLYTQREGDPGLEAAALPKPEKLLDELTIEGVARYIKTDQCKNVIVMTGAGISTSAGIPDFRSPGTGLYDNLQKFNLPNPQAIFEIGFFKENPDPFFTLAKELYPGQFKPTPCHYFIKLLAEKGLLQRAYTQNIDTLEHVAGVPRELVMEAHGTFHTGHCLGDCGKEYSQEWMRKEIFCDRTPKCPDCEGLVKPDIVFFGESLPTRFFPLVMEDFPKCDLLIIMGTSLVVQPFASLVDRVRDTTPRLLINIEKTGQSDPLMSMLGMGSGMDFDSDQKYRDVAQLGTCDEGCYKLAELLGWKADLDEMISKEHAKIDAAKAAATSSSSAATPSSAAVAAEVPKDADTSSQPKETTPTAQEKQAPETEENSNADIPSEKPKTEEKSNANIPNEKL